MPTQLPGLDPLPALADADLLLVRDDTDATDYKGTAQQIKEFATDIDALSAPAEVLDTDLLMMRDVSASENTKITRLQAQLDSVNAAAGASGVTLASTSASVQVFTPVGSITVKLDNSFSAGRRITIVNNGTNTITVTAQDNSSISAILPSSSGVFECLTSAPANSAAWSRLGFALPTQYIGDGTTYNGVSLTVTGTNWTTVRAVFVPYQTSPSRWRVRFNITGTVSSASRTTYTVTVAGIVARNVANDFQSLSGFGSANLVTACFATPNAATLTWGHATATTTAYFCSGDIELESQPTWVG